MKAMSSNTSLVDKRDKYEDEFLMFLLKRIGSAGGSLQLQHIISHLSQLSYDVRCNIGTSKSDLVDFLKRHRDSFCILGDTVKIVDCISSNNGGYDSDSSSVDPQSSLPENIVKGKGVIIKIFSKYGFIKAKEPVKSMVYFSVSSYGNKVIDLTSTLYIGAMVYFHAKISNDDSRSKYSARKVWKVDKSDMLTSITANNSRKNRDTGLYDPITLDSEGVIQKVFPNLGFIAVKGDETNTVFFHKNRLLKYDNIVDLTKVLSEGDVVEFTAHRSTKHDAKARWEATKVWKKSGKMKEKSTTAESDSGFSNHSFKSKTDKESKNSVKEMIKSMCGKICPRSQGAVIKFGENELADGDASVYYISGCQVTDISWEFSEGDDVYFDAVKIKSAPGWKAVLVWVGEKPDIVLSTCLGDFSEFTDDETEDNLSSCMSYSSNSSIKSVSAKSQCSSVEMRKVCTETSSRSSNFSDNKELKKKSHDSYRCGSQSSLSSIKSKSSQRSTKEKRENSSLKKSLNAENQSISSWGDSPYPADYNCQNISKTRRISKVVKTLNYNKDVKALNEEVQAKLDNSSSENEEIKCKNKVISESKTKEKETPSIKKFNCVKGKIIKVYSKFAEVKAKKAENMLSFFWNNFYFNGVSIEELELDDLKQVLKVGEIVYLNYFEIIDDSGQNWQKVSLAWKNSKQPVNISEMSPEDFIKQNNLSVSLSCKTIIDNLEESQELQCQEYADNVVCKKYLTAVEDLGPENQVDKFLSESCSEDKSLTSPDYSNESKLKKTQSPLDYEMLSSAIIQILEKSVFSAGSKVDLNLITEEIISEVIDSDLDKKCEDKFCQTLFPKENFVNASSNVICRNCGNSFVLNSINNTNTKNSVIQTIITGEVIAQNIFTDC